MNSQRIENIAAAEEYLNRIPRFSKVKHDMSDLRTMLRMLDAEFEEDRVVHVAGTNGKGSVCAFLTSILRSAGKTTATFTSPHLVSVRERFRFDGEMISETGFMDAFRTVHQAEEVFAGAGMTIPTYFEYLFLIVLTHLCLDLLKDLPGRTPIWHSCILAYKFTCQEIITTFVICQYISWGSHYVF